jgi:hypothetical protein
MIERIFLGTPAMNTVIEKFDLNLHEFREMVCKFIPCRKVNVKVKVKVNISL